MTADIIDFPQPSAIDAFEAVSAWSHAIMQLVMDAMDDADELSLPKDARAVSLAVMQVAANLLIIAGDKPDDRDACGRHNGRTVQPLPASFQSRRQTRR